jgi:Ca-activated chloride channel homolog
MKRSQLFVLLAALAAVAVIAVASKGNGNEHGGAAKAASTAAPKNAVVVSVASSPEKLALVQKAAAAYNATNPRVNGRPVVVTAKKANSGEEETAIAAAARGERGDQPVVWSPASSLWAQLLDHDTDQELVPADTPSIVRSPLVLAMWEPMARALGWPQKKIGWADVFRLARNPRDWATYAPPGYGGFKLVHTNPSVSTSGLEAVSAAYFAATGKKEGLTIADVDRPDVDRQIRAIENSIVHYGDATPFIEGQLRKYGPGYASAAAMEETTLVDFNKNRGGQAKLVGIYPSEGTFYSDSPYVVLNAPWVDKDERAAAAGFQRFVAEYVTPEVAARYGFRPPDPAAAPVAPVDAEHGADPTQPTRVLVAPKPAVLNHIQRAWFKNRKAANIMLVVDTSGSMYREGRLVHAKRGLLGFLTQLSPRDRVGLIRFSDNVQSLVPIRPFAENAGELRSQVRKLIPDGNTALYAATAKAVDDVAELNDPTRINAVVLLTDGEDTVGKPRMDQLIPKLESHAGDETMSPIRVFPIAYGKEAQASKQVFERIAGSSDGSWSPGDTGNIESVYRSISSFF